MYIPGGLSVAVLAQVAGMWEAWQRFGRVPWSDLFQPAIRMARYGMVVDPNLAGTLKQKEAIVRTEPSLR